MAEAKEVKNNFTFVKGFITEASGLNFPEDASIDEENFDLFLDGSRKKRFGIDFDNEDLFGADPILKVTIDSIATTSYLWEGAGEDGNLSILVVQQGDKLYFSNAGGPDIGVIRLAALHLSAFQKSSNFANVPLSFTSSSNRLFLASSALHPFYIKHTFVSPGLIDTKITLEVRDLDGLDDGTENNFRPDGLINPSQKYYNLLNQGWTTFDDPGNPVVVSKDSSGSDVAETSSTADSFKTINGVWPSNSDIFHLGKLQSAKEPKAVGAFFMRELKKIDLGNTKAPRGRVILDAFNKVRDSSSTSDETISLGPDSVAFYAGRTFYGQGSKIYFSQIIIEDVNIGKCYQEGDPTSEDRNSIVDTDGGEISISEASGIKQLITFSDKIVVFAQNGVWAIDGADAAFSATNFRVSKITDTGVSSSLAAITADDRIVYTAPSGIYIISYNQATGLLSSQNISQNTIQTFYNNTIAPGVLTIKGKYDRLNKKVFWLFNDGTSQSRYYDILILDISLNAFYKYRLGTLDGTVPFITDYQESSSISAVIEEFNVITSTEDTVIDSSLDQVIADEDRFFSKTSIFNFLAYRSEDASNYGLGSASFKDFDFVDWASQAAGGADYESFMTAGYELNNDLMRKKQSPIIQAAFNRSESRYVDNGSGGVEFDRPSSCLMKGAWDWSDNTVSGKIGSEQEIYRFRRAFLHGQIGQVFDNGLPIVTTRTKLRGRGRAFSVNFRSPAGKDCQLLGWSVLFAGNTTP